MKVCYIITTTINCGPVNVLYNLLVNYHNLNNFEPTIITLKPDDVNKSRRKDFEDLGINVVEFKNDAQEKENIFKFIEKNDFNIVHSHGLIPDLINSYVKKKEHTQRFHLTTLHNYPFEDYPQRKGKVLGNLMAIVHLYAIRNLYKVACSEAIAKRFATIGIKTKVIQNGIIFSNKFEGKQKIIPIKTPIFLYLGRIHTRKNVPFLVNYFKKHPEYEFWIVGDGAEYENVKQLAINANNIKVLGKTEHPNEMYQQANYYISASKSEGLPLSVLEALSFGLPCVLSDIDSHKEIITNSSLGELFINNDEDSLNNAVKKVASTKYNGQQIYNEIKDKFSSDVMMNKYYSLYQKNII